MNKKNNLSRSHLATRSSLSWYMDVGHHFATLTETQARDIARVNRTTFDRWLRGESSAPPATLELLRLHAYGEPPCGFSKAWAGFRFQHGKLIAEHGDEWTPGDLKAVFYWKKMAFQNMRDQPGGINYDKIRGDLETLTNNNKG